jgi:hypothetical protein
MSSLWMCECNTVSTVGHFIGCSCSVQVGKANEGVGHLFGASCSVQVGKADEAGCW